MLQASYTFKSNLDKKDPDIGWSSEFIDLGMVLGRDHLLGSAPLRKYRRGNMAKQA